MNRCIISFILVMLVMVFTSTNAHAITYGFTDSDTTSYWVDNHGSGRYTGFTANLDFPDGGQPSDYLNGNVFEFDTIFNITSFEITLSGHGDNSSQDIDIFFNVNGNWEFVAAYDVGYNTPFTLSIDLLSQQLKYNGSDVAPISYDMSNFVGIDSFQVAYGCHFWHDSTSVAITAEYSHSQVIPEPLTIIMFISSLAGLSFRRIKKLIIK